MAKRISNWEGRKRRVKFLAEHYVELGLANYPWGLSRTVSPDRVERFRREFRIFQRLRNERLLSDLTNFPDVNLNNLIIDAKKLYIEIQRELKNGNDEAR